MKDKGLDITGHRSTDVEDLDLSSFELVVAFESRIAKRLRSEFGLRPSRLRVLDIKDPFWGGPEDYQQCAETIEAALPTVLR
jgi:protein-tyrosine-phosphatase